MPSLLYVDIISVNIQWRVTLSVCESAFIEFAGYKNLLLVLLRQISSEYVCFALLCFVRLVLPCDFSLGIFCLHAA